MNEQQVRSSIPTEIVKWYGVSFEPDKLNINQSGLITVYYDRITEIEHDEIMNRIRLHCGDVWVSFCTSMVQIQITVWGDE